MNFYGNADKATRARVFGQESDRKTPDRKRATGGWAAEKRERKEKKTRKIYATRIRAADTNHRFSGRARLSRHWFRPAARTRRYVSFFLFFLRKTNHPRLYLASATSLYNGMITRTDEDCRSRSLNLALLRLWTTSLNAISLLFRRDDAPFYCEHYRMRILRYVLKLYFIIFIFRQDIFARDLEYVGSQKHLTKISYELIL